MCFILRPWYLGVFSCFGVCFSFFFLYFFVFWDGFVLRASYLVHFFVLMFCVFCCISAITSHQYLLFTFCPNSPCGGIWMGLGTQVETLKLKLARLETSSDELRVQCEQHVQVRML